MEEMMMIIKYKKIFIIIIGYLNPKNVKKIFD